MFCTVIVFCKIIHSHIIPTIRLVRLLYQLLHLISIFFHYWIQFHHLLFLLLFGLLFTLLPLFFVVTLINIYICLFCVCVDEFCEIENYTSFSLFKTRADKFINFFLLLVKFFSVFMITWIDVCQINENGPIIIEICANNKIKIEIISEQIK